MLKSRLNFFLLFSTSAAALISLFFLSEIKSERAFKQTTNNFNIKKRNQILDWQKSEIQIKNLLY